MPFGPAKEFRMRYQLGQAFRFTLLMTVLTGLIYPGVVTGLCQLLFPHPANGSLLEVNGKILGSTLLGQNFSKPEYFHPRPSAAGNEGYDATASGGSNFGPTNQKLIDRVKADIAKFRAENPGYQGPIPADMVTTSASGLDPDISLASALAQAPRVAQARSAALDQVRQLIEAHTEGRQWGFLGEPRVNVLLLNLALNAKFPLKKP
jgi:K+-transporting ATPase ATPase C chain